MYEARYVILFFNARATNLFSNLRGQGDKVNKSESTGVNVFAFKEKTKTIVRKRYWSFLVIYFGGASPM